MFPPEWRYRCFCWNHLSSCNPHFFSVSTVKKMSLREKAGRNKSIYQSQKAKPAPTRKFWLQDSHHRICCKIVETTFLKMPNGHEQNVHLQNGPLHLHWIQNFKTEYLVVSRILNQLCKKLKRFWNVTEVLIYRTRDIGPVYLKSKMTGFSIIVQLNHWMIIQDIMVKSSHGQR